MKKSPDDNTIPLPEKSYLYVADSQLHAAGQGLFTAIPIYRGEVIAVFAGERLTNRQASLRAGKGCDQYFIAMPDGSILDSMKTACFAKYANDASVPANGPFKNNGRMELNEAEHVCITATRNIRQGEEIFCGYGKRYWLKHLKN